MNLIFEVLRLVSAVFRTASVVQTIDKSPLHGHLGPYSQTRLKLHLDSNLPDKQL